MKAAFFRALLRLAESDARVELVVGDIGFGAVEEFANRFPDRFLNAGVAEQNMIGVSTGLALSGSIVFVYSIGNFPTLRCLEQVRSDVCYHRANVKIVSVGGGLSYGALGASHHATEDLAILRVLPEMTVAAPGDVAEAESLTRELVQLDGPAYMRLDKAEYRFHEHTPDLPPGSSVQVVDGNDVALLVTGGMLSVAIDAAEGLARGGFNARVVSMPWVTPLDRESVLAAGRDTRLVVTLEEHSATAGLGGAVAEIMAEETLVAPLLRIGLPPHFGCLVGDQEYLRRAYGLDAPTIIDQVARRLTLQAHPTGW